VQVVGAGVAQNIGFSRWGRYSAATVDEQGKVWAAAEYIPVASFGAASNGGEENWGTFLWRLASSDHEH
jgi:hypothetical protein